MCGVIVLAPMASSGPLPNHVLSVIPLCVGWDAPGHALRGMGQPCRYLHAYDTDEVVRPVLEWLHGTETVSHFHLGAELGDLTQAHWWDWERADAVVTGPPCPPVSRIGKRLRGKDPRQKVWDTCVDIIIDQGWKGALFFLA